MGKRILLFVVVTMVALVVAPALASANLINEYGMHYAGKKCVDCHSGMDQQIHGRFATPGMSPEAPWATIQAVGGVGESYSVAGNTWITLGDVLGNSATEYLFWKGTTDPTVMPWNLIEGLAWEPHEGWMVAHEDPEGGLFDEPYACQRCHQLGSTVPGADAVPNPAATRQPTATTARQWARDESKTVDDFMSDPSVSYAGLGIQCENCHGTGQPNSPGAHAGPYTGVNTLTSLETLGQSQVCGQCHGSYTNATGTMGIYGYTPNLPMRDFVDINGVSGGQSYTYIPTVEEFLANPTAYWMFPNGSNAKGNHYYYNEWAASGHSWRGALTKDSPDATAFQMKGTSHYSATAQSTIDSKCYQCHTGEGYLSSKDAEIAEDFKPTASNTGFMGQECVTCHNGHPSAIGAEDVVREPDSAGERSAKGLTTDNASICEDCHNWQFEVQGTTPAYKPVTPLTSRGGPSHPQRETVHGRVMVDVPAAGEFMPGATCEDCHMVKTNKAATRISHGMKPMLPGDAETWNNAAGSAYQGEDSCSGCHGGQTRGELQENIETWQADATATADAAAAAINAAITRAGDAVSDPASDSYTLIGRATWNYKAFVNDASTGVHNPEYIMAGLEKAEQMADSVGGSFSAVFASKSVVYGGTGFITGKAVNGDGSGAALASLVLYKDGAATEATTTTDAQGAFAFMITPMADATYKVVWARSGVAGTDLASKAVKVAMTKIASKTTIKASATSIALGKSVKLTGKVAPAMAGKSVRIQYRRGTSGSWKTLATGVKLGDMSQYSKLYKPAARGAFYFRTQFAGTATVASSTSAGVKVTVK